MPRVWAPVFCQTKGWFTVGQNILEMRGISKYFPGIKALDHVDFTMRSGEVHALIGENGAGKSTLVKVLTGVHRPNAGTIFFQGTERDFRNPIDARLAGIAADPPGCDALRPERG